MVVADLLVLVLVLVDVGDCAVNADAHALMFMLDALTLLCDESDADVHHAVERLIVRAAKVDMRVLILIRIIMFMVLVVPTVDDAVMLVLVAVAVALVLGLVPAVTVSVVLQPLLLVVLSPDVGV